MTGSLAVSLITLGDPRQLSGSYLYHKHMAALAPRYGAQISFVSLPKHPFPFSALYGRRALDQALADAPSVVLVDSNAATAIASALPRHPLPVPLRAVVHQPPGGLDHGPVRTRVQSLLDMLLYRRADVLIVASQMLAEEMGRRGIPAKRVHVVTPGRGTVAAGEEGAAGIELRWGSPVAFLCVANWLPRKGIHQLIEAFALLPRSAGVLHLVGDHQVAPEYARSITRQLTAPLLSGRVFVHGAQPPAAMANFYRAADIFVLPSDKEPRGMVYGEAIAAGLPVVGLNAGNLPYIVTHGVEGLLVTPDDVSGLARAMQTLAGDEALRKRMGEAAHQRAMGWPTWEESAAAFFAAVGQPAMARTVVN